MVRPLRRAPRPQHLQKYCDLPPGPGMAVVYVGRCRANGKMYIGKHCHGRTGHSVRCDRWKRTGYSSCTVMQRALNAHGGIDGFDWWIIEHVPEEDVQAREAFWISPHGCNTIAPRGMNIMTSDASVPMSAEGRARISASAKVAQNRPEVKAANRERAKTQFAKPGARNEHSKRMLQLHQGSDGAALRSKLSTAIAKGMKAPTVRAKLQAAMARRKADAAGWEKLMARLADGRQTDAYRANQRAAALAPSRNAKLRESIESTRQGKLDACSTELEREALAAHFAKLDLLSRARARVRV